MARLYSSAGRSSNIICCSSSFLAMDNVVVSMSSSTRTVSPWKILNIVRSEEPLRYSWPLKARSM